GTLQEDRVPFALRRDPPAVEDDEDNGSHRASVYYGLRPPLLVIRALAQDLERPVDLLEHHHPGKPVGEREQRQAPAELRRGDDPRREPLVAADGEIEADRGVAQAPDPVGEGAARHLLAALVDRPQLARPSRQG